jgi:hypothetical protein
LECKQNAKSLLRKNPKVTSGLSLFISGDGRNGDTKVLPLNAKRNHCGAKKMRKNKLLRKVALFIIKPPPWGVVNSNNKSKQMSTKRRKNSRKSMSKKTAQHRPKERFSIKSWPPEVNAENPSPIGATIIIAVVLLVGLFIWLQTL